MSDTAPQHTPGPWRFEVNQQTKHLTLSGGGGRKFDLTILEPIRWGMGSATLLVRDTAEGGRDLLHKLHERPDWMAPFPGREHHADWYAGVTHPDLRLIEAAPDLLEALRAVLALAEGASGLTPEDEASLDAARAAIAKATRGVA